MPELGPRLIEVSESFSVFGQRGGSPDSDFIELHLNLGEKVNVEVNVESGCVVFSNNDGVIYLPVSKEISAVFGKRMPSVKQILVAQSGVTIYKELPLFLQDILCEMVDTVTGK